ncbi:hypothetical protein ANCCAN_17594 [Ancylostoma caninum]|uniref:Uncharacterized protein n=1 Tax=Ancylostoma caninum TaxID=29170 RepID=A0A368FYH2_ANCCA|nr:hypothetical protein ANCCAN_17594 [Ancylostoma caninum]
MGSQKTSRERAVTTMRTRSDMAASLPNETTHVAPHSQCTGSYRATMVVLDVPQIMWKTTRMTRLEGTIHEFIRNRYEGEFPHGWNR